jgi:hypothetical protein
MSRLSTIFRRRGGDSGSGQETQGQNAPAGGAGPAPDSPGFRDRGKFRRRLRYLRRVRDLQLRDLGGLVYETYRQKRPSQELVDRKVSVLAATDSELSGLEVALDDRRPLRELRMPGIGGECPRCGEVYGSAARFCSNCGAGLAREAEAAVGQFGGAPAAPRPAAAPAAAAAAPAGSVLANWSSVGAIPTTAPAEGASKAATPGSEAKRATSGSEAKPATSGTEAKPTTPAPEAKPATSGSEAKPTTPAPEAKPATSGPAAKPAKEASPSSPPAASSGGQGIGSGDPLGQTAPAASPPSGRQGIGSGDPLGQRPPVGDRGSRAPVSSGDPLASPRPAAAGPAPEDETVVMRGNDDKPAGGDDASRNGGDESHTKARAARSPDESE